MASVEADDLAIEFEVGINHLRPRGLRKADRRYDLLVLDHGPAASPGELASLAIGVLPPVGQEECAALLRIEIEVANTLQPTKLDTGRLEPDIDSSLL